MLIGLAFADRRDLGVLLFRIAADEALPHQEFGPAGDAYCKRSWRFLPYHR